MLEYKFITKIEHLIEYMPILRSAKVIAADTETTGLSAIDDRVRLLQLAVENGCNLVIDMFNFDDYTVFREIFGGNSVKVFQNAKFDLKFLMALDIPVCGNIFDTMIAAQLLRTSGGSGKVGLGHLAEFYLDEDLPKDEQISDWTGVLSDSQKLYAAKDAEILLRLRNKMIPLLVQHKLTEVARLEFACVKAVAKMEFDGMYLHPQKWLELTENTRKSQENALKKMKNFAKPTENQMSLFGLEQDDTNYDSQKQVLEYLANNGIHLENTSKYALYPYIDNPAVAALMEYRKSTKALTAFLDTLGSHVNAKTGRIHAEYSQMGAWSGRMSCYNPNMQQIPRDADFRACFSAMDGNKLIIADYSQIELRVAAEITGDMRMINAYKNGEDLHKLTASLITEKPMNEVTKSERQAAKAVNFGLIYAMGAKGLQRYSSQTYGVEMTLEQAEEFRRRFFAAYSGIAEWHKKIRNNPPKESRTLSGRKHIFSGETMLSSLCNTPVQGTAADIAKNALSMLFTELQGTSTKIIGVVHDEILLEAKAEKADETAILLKNVMEKAGERYIRNVPIIAEVHVADSWAEK